MLTQIGESTGLSSTPLQFATILPIGHLSHENTTLLCHANYLKVLKLLRLEFRISHKWKFPNLVLLEVDDSTFCSRLLLVQFPLCTIYSEGISSRGTLWRRREIGCGMMRLKILGLKSWKIQNVPMNKDATFLDTWREKQFRVLRCLDTPPSSARYEIVDPEKLCYSRSSPDYLY